jgi:hypothetical protein
VLHGVRHLEIDSFDDDPGTDECERGADPRQQCALVGE